LTGSAQTNVNGDFASRFASVNEHGHRLQQPNLYRGRIAPDGLSSGAKSTSQNRTWTI
jgi:hypothetical protein